MSNLSECFSFEHTSMVAHGEINWCLIIWYHILQPIGYEAMIGGLVASLPTAPSGLAFSSLDSHYSFILDGLCDSISPWPQNSTEILSYYRCARCKHDAYVCLTLFGKQIC